MKYQVMRALTSDEYAELKASIIENGVLVPIVFDEHKNIIDGHHRKQICDELGIAKYPTSIVLGLTKDEKINMARQLNEARRQLTAVEKRTETQRRLMETPELSDRAIAKQIGVSNPYVSGVRKEMELSGELLMVNSSIGVDGKERPREVIRKLVDSRELEPIYEHEIDYNASADVYDRNEVRQRMIDDGTKPDSPFEQYPVLTSTKSNPHVASNSGNNEWYTPSEYIEAAREVMGAIDLDPASCAFANKVVQASNYYTSEDDGLAKDWRGRIWMNPPYSGNLVSRFVTKLTEQVACGNTTDAVVLVNNATETAWFNALIKSSTAVVFLKSRVRFYTLDGTRNTPLQGQAIVYFGNNEKDFIRVYRQFGWGAIPCR
jgi:Predicted transcriptional regulators